MVNPVRCGSLFLSRPAIMPCMADPKHIVTGAVDLFDAVLNQAVTVNVNQTWPLKDTAEAHRAVETSQATESVVLLP